MKRFAKNAAAILMLSICSVASAGGGGMSGGALESTQLLNKAELIKEVAEAVKQTQELINQYQNMLQNTLQLPLSIWQDVTGTITELQNLYGSFKSLSLASAFDFEKFKIQHPGYRDVTNSPTADIDFSQIYKERVAQLDEYAAGVLEANNMEVQNVKDSQSTIKQLNEASKSSVGQMQALQAGNQIATFMAQELAELRIDMARQIDLQTEIALNEQQERTDEEAAFEQAISTWKPLTPGKKF
jgi:P-type conjugative transfer protein TrbJ